MNLYGYVLGDPVNGIDPLGLATWGVCLARDYLKRYKTPKAAWYAIYTERMKVGMWETELRNAEHYIWAQYKLSQNSYYWGIMHFLTTGYHAAKFWTNVADYYIDFGSPFKHTPPTLDELQAGYQGANDALFGSDEDCGCPD